MNKTTKLVTLLVALIGLLFVALPAPAQATTAPTGDLPGWKQIFVQNFDTPATLRNFLKTYTDMGAYPYPYTDTSRNLRSNPGYYHPEKTLSAANGVMDAWLHYDATMGKYLVAAPKPKLPTMLYGRFAIRLRADVISGYKIAPLLWPDSEVWPGDGEIDFPEGDLNGSSFAAFAHYANPSGGQNYFNAKADPTAWHTYEIAWAPGKIEFFVDNVSIGVSTTNVPTKPMHWVLQMETTISAAAPATNAQGHVQIDWIKAYSYNPATAPVVTVPAPPTALQTARVTQSSVSLAWNASPGATGYQVRRNNTLISTVNTTAFTDSGLKPASKNTYTVVAMNSAGVSGPSSPLSVMTAPAPVKKVNVKALSNTKVQVSWSASAGATSYQVFRSNVYRGVTTTLSFKDKAVVHARSYAYKVVAVVNGQRSLPTARTFAT